MNCVDCHTSFDEKIEILCPKCSSQYTGNFFLDTQNCVNFLHRINKQLLALELRLKDLPESDRRKQFGKSVIMFNLSEMTRLIQMPVGFANSNCTLDRLIKENNDYSALSKLYEPILQKIMLYHMMSYLTTVLFQLEFMIKEICVSLGYNGKMKYHHYCKYLVEKMSVENTETLDKLTYPSHFRNTLHNNGVYIDYNKQDRKFTINGHELLLSHEKNSQVSWRLIIFMINSLIPVVEEIIDFSIKKKVQL